MNRDGTLTVRTFGLSNLGFASARMVRRHGLPVLIFIAISFATMYPVTLDPRGRVIGWKGDNVQYVYMTSWVGRSLLIGQSPLIDPA